MPCKTIVGKVTKLDLHPHAARLGNADAWARLKWCTLDYRLHWGLAQRPVCHAEGVSQALSDSLGWLTGWELFRKIALPCCA